MSMELPLLFGQPVRHIHAVGVGGMGLGPLAIYLAKRGWTLTGEDDALSSVMALQLKRAGVTLIEGGALPSSVDLVVYSSAIGELHEARVKATVRGIPQVRRGNLLAELAKGKRLVGVCGSHGKTTATAMIVSALKESKCDVGYLLGGLFSDDSWSPAEVGSGDWLVAEIDESDGTINGFTPEILLVVNLDWDHPDQYKSLDALKSTFRELIGRTSGAVLGWSECARTTSLMAPTSGGAKKLTFGEAGDFWYKTVKSNLVEQELKLGGRFEVPAARLKARGDFNAVNASGALAAIQMMGLPVRDNSLANFPGVKRRQTMLLQQNGITVLEDYAHHPEEVSKLLQSLRKDLKANEKLKVVFQPHRYSRTLQFKTEFARVLAKADELFLLDVYSAGEPFQAGGTTDDLKGEIERTVPDLKMSYWPNDPSGVLQRLHQSVIAGDCVVFVGAGDIEKWAKKWVTEWKLTGQGAVDWTQLAERLRISLSAQSLVKQDEILAKKTTIRLGGAARLYVEPANESDLQTVVRVARELGVASYVLGRGSNLLVPDAGVEGIVIAMRHENWATFEPLGAGLIQVGAGLRLKNLCGLAAKAGLEGFEFLEGIPGNIGGALRMNAGAMGGWMFDVVEEVRAIDADGNQVVWVRDELHTGYRHCEELKNAIAIGAKLKAATQAHSDEIGRQIDVYRSKRQESQPREPSAGCIFKNPEGDSAGRLIEQSGLKGVRVGDAEVSMVHGNFIVNRGKATSADVIGLVRKVRGEVAAKTGKLLEPEVLLYGAKWEDVL